MLSQADSNGLASNFGVIKPNTVSTRTQTWNTNTYGEMLSEGTVTTLSGRETKEIPVLGDIPITGQLPVPATNGQFYTSLSAKDAFELRGTTANGQNSTVLAALGASSLSGYVDKSAQWNLGTSNEFNPRYFAGGAGKSTFSFFDATTNSVVTIDPESHNLIISADDDTSKQLLAAIKKLDQPARQQLVESGAPISGSDTFDTTTVSGGTLAANSTPQVTVVHLQNANPQDVAKALQDFPGLIAQSQQSSPLIQREQQQFNSQQGGFGGGGGAGGGGFGTRSPAQPAASSPFSSAKWRRRQG